MYCRNGSTICIYGGIGGQGFDSQGSTGSVGSDPSIILGNDGDGGTGDKAELESQEVKVQLECRHIV
ncbi:MAG: hypothetical protein LBU04_04755 [Christensenellaceae bacterium]|nr:hypothetical protein [Christensenellaceae bacterium]